MRVYSFVRRGIDLETIEVEISLVPGLPAFHIIGLPDTAIKESVLRIKSGLRHQGFKLPTRDQVLVHLKPSNLKKSSQGLDLAIAAAYLMQTGQIENLSQDHPLYFYGEVSLEGFVTAPQDLELLEALPSGARLVVGASEGDGRSAAGAAGVLNAGGLRHLPFHHGRVESLQALQSVRWCEGEFDRQSVETGSVTRFENFEFGEPLAQLLAVSAAGEHNVFVAGPAGTGKTTFSEVLHALLRKPTLDEQRKIDKITRITRRERCGRPYVCPHHSSSDIALLGGGVPPYPGEITRAQHGVLVLDEYLEFEHYVKESLREPVEKHQITVSRAGAQVTFPADFLMVGTTNLCPCGDYVPGREAPCGQSSTRCKSYYMRLSGPMLDRYEIISFSHAWKTRKKMGFSDIFKKVRAAQDFARRTRGQTVMNSRLSLPECELHVPEFVRRHLMPEMPASHRRQLALLRVARTVADLEESTEVSAEHIEAAKNLTIQPFKEMKEAWR